MTSAGSEGPAIAVIIPSLRGEVDGVLASLARQTLQPDEVAVVTGVRPNGRARNVGLARTRAPLVVFVDDDAVLGPEDALRRLVQPLADPTVGASGCAKLLPPGASRFQRWVGRQVPRIERPVVSRLTESNPPVGRHGYTDVTTTCCAMRRETLERCGGFDERLRRGVDSELLYRLRLAGLRLVLVPWTWTWHPAPSTLRELLRKHFAYGAGYAQEVQKHPERAAGRYLHTPAHAGAYLLVRTALLLPHAVLPVSWPHARRRPWLRPLRALTSYAAALGYVHGWYRHPYRDARADGTPRGSGAQATVRR